MTHQIAHSISLFLCQKGEIEKEDTDIYEYGFEVFIDGVLETLLLIAIGTILNKFTHTIMFISLFVILRNYTGGYHASTKLRCIFTTIMIYLCNIVMTEADYNILIIISTMAYVLLFIYAPIENVNKQLEESTFIKNRRISRIIGFICWAGILLLKDSYELMGSIAAVTLIQVTILIMVERGKGFYEKGD